MKTTLVKACVLFLCVMATGCSTNSTSENTVLGTVAGVAVGGGLGALIGNSTAAAVGGAVAGGIIGGVIGYNMDSSDKARMYQVMDTSPAKKTHCWTNKKTTTAYRVTPTSTTMSYAGQHNCRSYQSDVTHNGKTQQYVGTACRQADGSWVDVTKKA